MDVAALVSSPAVKRALEALRRPMPLTRCSGGCPVCKLAPAKRAELARLFVRWMPPRDLASWFRVPEQSIRRHAAALDLDVLRAECSVLALAQIVERGMTGQAPRSALTHALQQLQALTPAVTVPEPTPAAPADDVDQAKPRTSWEEAVRQHAARKGGE